MGRDLFSQCGDGRVLAKHIVAYRTVIEVLILVNAADEADICTTDPEYFIRGYCWAPVASSSNLVLLPEAFRRQYRLSCPQVVQP